MWREMELLRFALKLDAGVSGVAGVAIATGAGVFDGELGAPAAALVAAGAVLVGWAVALWTLASRRDVTRRTAWTVIARNVAWAGASGLVALDWSPLTAAGTALVLMQAVAVVVLADLQYLGLRRA